MRSLKLLLALTLFASSARAGERTGSAAAHRPVRHRRRAARSRCSMKDQQLADSRGLTSLSELPGARPWRGRRRSPVSVHVESRDGWHRRSTHVRSIARVTLGRELAQTGDRAVYVGDAATLPEFRQRQWLELSERRHRRRDVVDCSGRKPAAARRRDPIENRELRRRRPLVHQATPRVHAGRALSPDSIPASRNSAVPAARAPRSSSSARERRSKSGRAQNVLRQTFVVLCSAV